MLLALSGLKGAAMNRQRLPVAFALTVCVSGLLGFASGAVWKSASRESDAELCRQEIALSREQQETLDSINRYIASVNAAHGWGSDREAELTKATKAMSAKQKTLDEIRAQCRARGLQVSDRP